MKPNSINIHEREIKLLDMFWAIVLEWRKITIITLICAACFSIYCHFSAYKLAEDTQGEEDKSIVLTEQEMEEVDMFYKYQNLLIGQTVYNETAPFMVLDSNGYYEAVLNYFVCGLSENENLDDTKNKIAIATYKSRIFSEEFLNETADILESEEVVKYIDEIIVVNDSENSVTELMDSSEGKLDYLTIKILHSDEDKCQQLSELVRKQMEEIKKETSVSAYPYECIFLSETCNLKANRSLLEYQEENFERVIEYEKKIDTIKAAFSDKQNAFIQNNEESETQNVKNDVEKQQPLKVIHIVIGLVLGVVLSVVYLAFAYLLSQKVRLEDDLETIFGLEKIGIINSTKPSKRSFQAIDNILLRLGHRNLVSAESDNMILTKIKLMCRRDNIQEISFVSTVEDSVAQKEVEILKQQLKGEGIRVITVGSILTSPAVLEKTVDAHATVILEKIGKSTYSNIAEEVKCCYNQDVSILGVVLFN